MKPVSLDKVSGSYRRRVLAKYWYVAKELGEGAKAEEVLKVMESLAGVSYAYSHEEKTTLSVSDHDSRRTLV